MLKINLPDNTTLPQSSVKRNTTSIPQKSNTPTDIHITLNTDTEYYSKDINKLHPHQNLLSLQISEPYEDRLILLSPEGKHILVESGNVNLYDKYNRDITLNPSQLTYIKDNKFVPLPSDKSELPDDTLEYERRIILEEINDKYQDFPPIQYLENKYSKIEFSYNSRPQYKLYITLFFYFGLAEISMFTGNYSREIVRRLINNKTISFDKHLQVTTSNGYTKWDNLSVILDGIPYELHVAVYDSCATGNQNYNDLLTNGGIPSDDKKLMDEYKSKMNKGLYKDPENYIKYACNDLYVYEAQAGMIDKFIPLSEALGAKVDFSNIKSAPKTFGSWCNKTTEAFISNLLGITVKSLKNNLQAYNGISSSVLQRCLDMTPLITKVIGGQCKKRRPSVVVIKQNWIDIGGGWKKCTNVPVDVDLSGAYASIQESLTTPIGTPNIYAPRTIGKVDKTQSLYDFFVNELGINVEYLLNCTNEEYVSNEVWGEFLSRSHFLFLVSGKFNKSFNKSIPSMTINGQKDFIKGIEKLIIGGAFNKSIEKLNSKSVGTKVFTDEISCGVFNDSTIQLLRQNPSAALRWMKAMVINCGAFYDKRYQVSIDDFMSLLENGELNKTVENYQCRVENGKLVNESIVENKYYWCEVDTGKLAGNILSNRKKAQVTYGKKSAEQGLLKLLSNGRYGTSASDLFPLSNSIVANQITGLCRLGAATMGDSLNCVQLITDGGFIHSDEIVMEGRDKVDFTNPEHKVLTSIGNRNLSKGKLPFELTLIKSDDRTEVIVTIDGEILYPVIDGDITYSDYRGNKDDIEKLINQKLVEYCQLTNPNIPAWDNIFKIEIKGIFDKVAYHGASDYIYTDIDGKTYRKMRGQKAAPHLLSDDTYVDISPVMSLLDGILGNPNSVKVQEPSVIQKILKTKLYLQKSDYFDYHDILPGQTYPVVVKGNLFTLSDYEWKSHEQLIVWTKLRDKLIVEHGWSFEGYFVNDDGTVDYELMLNTINQLVIDGCMNPVKALDPYCHRVRDDAYKSYPYFKIWQMLRDNTGKLSIDENFDGDYVEDEDTDS